MSGTKSVREEEEWFLSRERDLWSLAAGERAATEESERGEGVRGGAGLSCFLEAEVGAVEGESSVLLVGSCNAVSLIYVVCTDLLLHQGKTSMILKLLERLVNH